MSFCTAINCMDGRVQSQVTDYLRNHFEVDFVDMITEPGPVALLAAGGTSPQLSGVLRCIDISVNKHSSVGLAIIAHTECAGNPVSKEQQFDELEAGARFCREKYPELEVITLWIGSDWRIERVEG